MIKVLSALFVLAVAVSNSEAKSANQWFYSPYSQKLVPIQRTIALSNKMANKMAMPELKSLNKIMPTIIPAAEPTVFKEDFCRGQKPEARIEFPGDTSKFIVCHLGEAFDIMSCPRHLVFNSHTSNCENSHRKPVGCKANRCQNGGKCIDLSLGQFTCECLPGFGGRVCESSRACEPNTCGPTGHCFEISRGSPLKHYCLCDNGLTYGLSCDSKVVPNPCMDNDADLHSFPTTVNKSIFVHCEGHIPHMKTCAFPLVYSHDLQRCDWE